jgi:predicted nucleic acid-binding protein
MKNGQTMIGHNMELNIIKQIRSLRNQLKRKPKDVVATTVIKEKLKELRPVIKRKEPMAKKRTTTLVEGKELTLAQIAKQYNLEMATVRARYRVGNRGKLLIRPSQHTHPKKGQASAKLETSSVKIL